MDDADTGKVCGETGMNREVIRWFGTACLLILLLALIVLPVKGAETPFILQGGAVVPGSYVDVSGCVGWSGEIAWYGQSGDLESNPQFVYTLPTKRNAIINTTFYVDPNAYFYVDPAIFGQRLGMWYQFYGNDTGIEHGNLQAFNVVTELPKVNGTPVSSTPVPTPTPIPVIVQPKRYDTDYQIAYGDPLSIVVNNKTMPARLWVFGRIDSVYNKTFPTSVVSLSRTEIQNLETGSYTVIVQNPGKNAVFELGYSKIVSDVKTVEELVGTPCTLSGCTVTRTNIYGFQPRMVMTEFRKMIKSTDDPITEYRIEVVHPTIDITSIDETYWEGKDVLDIRGYTNVAKDTPIAFVMDKDKQTEKTLPTETYMESVKQDAPNKWGYFQVRIPIDYEEIPVGQHEITATVPQGATQTVPFYVYDLPEGQEVPNETVKYVAGDLFRPTPTPERIVETITVIETQTIFVPVTPNDEQVYLAQKRASDANWKYWMTTLGLVLVVGTMVSLGSWYMWGVIKRARRKKK